MLNFIVSDRRCTRCGLCAKDCPAEIIEQSGKALPLIKPEQEEECLQCQHCLAICPPGAIAILGKNPANSLPVTPDALPRFEQMLRLVRSRRSVRKYRDENVAPAVIDQLLAALANVPTGVNARELTFNVIADKAVMQRFREQALETLAAAETAGLVPERFAFIQGLGEAYAQKGEDMILRGAPHVLIVSAPPDAPCAVQDVALALAYFELLAQSAGLGTVWCGLLVLLLETLPELKPQLGLPADHVYYPMLFGPPAVRYPRTVQRDDAMQVHRVML